ncbi:MAG: branched-chain amino acid ABC transporter permease [Thermoprotei archaeon]
MAFDFLGFGISLVSSFGIYAILALSLNLEYGYGGQPNFGQALFYGMGAFAAAIVASNLLFILTRQPLTNICTISSLVQRESIAATDPGVTMLAWVLSGLVSVIVGAILGFVASYPALRVKEEWYLAMVLLVAAQIFGIVFRYNASLGCGFDGIAGISNPFLWLTSTGVSIISSTDTYQLIYAGVIALFAFLCFRLTMSLTNSPFGRDLKAIRDDLLAASMLGKNVNKIRSQVMVIGSAMAALAGWLYVYYVGVANTADYTSTFTFSIWVMMILGGFANNKGAIVGALVLTLINQLSLVGSTLLQAYVTGFNPSIVDYSKYLFESLLLLLLLLRRPKGLLKESRIDTPAYKVFGEEKNG